jgi:hypothetical protein
VNGTLGLDSFSSLGSDTGYVLKNVNGTLFWNGTEVGSGGSSSSSYGYGIIDSGSNENGSYMKFADGTMTQWGNVAVSPGVGGPENGYWYYGIRTITWPVAFVSQPSGTVTPVIGSALGSVNYYSNLTTTGAEVNVISNSNSNPVALNYVVYGRWTNLTNITTGLNTTTWANNQDGDVVLVNEGVKVGIGTSSPSAELEVDGYTKLGNDAPAIKVKKLTGTTASSMGGTNSVAHGLDASKIIGITGFIEYTTDNYMQCGAVQSGYQSQVEFNSTSAKVYLHTSESGNLLSKPFTILITYEE